MNVTDTWASLRATRAEPPGLATDRPERRATYVAALEQSEQLFRAAATVGTAARPLLIFYGLSQAGRAIAAASPVQGNDWMMSGHGINSRKLDGHLEAVEVRGDASKHGFGSFVRLSQILNSPTMGPTEPALFGDLWDLLPEATRWPLTPNSVRRTALFVCAPTPVVGNPLILTDIAYFPPSIVAFTKDGSMFEEFMSGYRDVAGYDVSRIGGPDSPPRFTLHQDGWGEVTFIWPGPEPIATPADRQEFLLKMAKPYLNAVYLFPSVGKNPTAMHPLMSWWAVLHALSMLARYQPGEWASHIDVDSSPYAVPLEQVLDAALTAVPALISQTIGEVTGAKPHLIW